VCVVGQERLSFKFRAGDWVWQIKPINTRFQSRIVASTNCLNAKGNPVATSKSVNKSKKPKNRTAPPSRCSGNVQCRCRFQHRRHRRIRPRPGSIRAVLRNIQPDCGMAFVLVSHLDPDHASMLTEILQRTTTMPVVEAQDQVQVAPNCVYVLPPNREMAIFHGALQLSTPEMPRGQRMVIDSFLRSLAEDQGEKPSASFSPAPAPTVRWDCAPFRARAASRWCRNLPLPNTTACRSARFTRVTRPIPCRWKKCRSNC